MKLDESLLIRVQVVPTHITPLIVNFLHSEGPHLEGEISDRLIESFWWHGRQLRFEGCDPFSISRARTRLAPCVLKLVFRHDSSRLNIMCMCSQVKFGGVSLNLELRSYLLSIDSVAQQLFDVFSAGG